MSFRSFSLSIDPIMKSKSPRHFRLLVTISVLFTILIVVFGLFLRQVVYWQTSEMLLTESNQQFTHLTDKLTLKYIGARKIVNQTVRILSKTGIMSATTLEERLGYVATFQAALKEDSNLSALQVGYDNGDYFIVRPLSTDYIKNLFSSPSMAALVVDNITVAGNGRRYRQRLWYTTSLIEIKRSPQEITDYDPRIRPWFKVALTQNNPVATAPYLFFFMKQMGITIAFRPTEAGAIIAGDLSLYNLSQILAKHKQTPNSEIVLLEKTAGKHWVVAYKKPEKLVKKQDENHIRSSVTDLDSDVLSYAASRPDSLDPFFTFSFDGQDWLGAARNLKLADRDNFYCLTLSPENELLLEAKELQDKALAYTIGMILITIPLTWLLAKKISTPMHLLARDAKRLSRFEFGTKKTRPSNIKEVVELDQAMTMLESTISQFLSLITSLAGEQDYTKLLKRITREIMNISEADGAFTYIVNKPTNKLIPETVRTKSKGELDPDTLPTYSLDEKVEIVDVLNKGERIVTDLETIITDRKLIKESGLKSARVIAVPAKNRRKETIGIMCLLFNSDRQIESEEQKGRLAFIDALSGFAAVTLESRQMLRMQKDLLESFIKLIAGAIDSKSPYTGGHCQRVPVITKLLAQKACESQDTVFADFNLTDEEWEAIHIASWLHDCGKVTTPEFVVDKATKLETLYDRIHEIRMRFEVLKRDAHINYFEKIISGGNRAELTEILNEELQQLDADFDFVAECNIGSEFIAPETLERLDQIAERTWTRTLDDRKGVSWEEQQRKEKIPKPPLPTIEKLIADRADHLFARSSKYHLAEGDEYGFNLDVPNHLYNRGELYNLSIARGTLTDEERYQINDHIVQTIIMLSKLPYPKHLQDVPNIAGGHHEKMDGTGYPRKLTGNQMSLPARMMVIADIFEALTASDRPYKQPKKLSEAIRIMGFMEKDRHIDGNLFKLFLSSGAYLEYAREYLAEDQLDQVDIEQYLNHT